MHLTTRDRCAASTKQGTHQAGYRPPSAKSEDEVPPTSSNGNRGNSNHLRVHRLITDHRDMRGTQNHQCDFTTAAGDPTPFVAGRADAYLFVQERHPLLANSYQSSYGGGTARRKLVTRFVNFQPSQTFPSLPVPFTSAAYWKLVSTWHKQCVDVASSPSRP